MSGDQIQLGSFPVGKLADPCACCMVYFFSINPICEIASVFDLIAFFSFMKTQIGSSKTLNRHASLSMSSTTVTPGRRFLSVIVFVVMPYMSLAVTDLYGEEATCS